MSTPLRPTPERVCDAGEAKQQTLEIFRRFDANGDGVISPDELRRVFRTIDPVHWSAERCGQLIEVVDVNQDGYIDYEEFVTWLLSGDDDGWADARAASRLRGYHCFSQSDLVLDSTKTTRDGGEFRVALVQGEGTKVGVKVDQAEDALVIKAVRPGGLLAEWNASNSQLQVVAGDAIVEVNTDTRGNPKAMMKELLYLGGLTITVRPRESAEAYPLRYSDFYDEAPAREEGAFGTIKRVTQKSTGMSFAMKTLSKNRTSKRKAGSEIAVMTSLDHPHVVKLHEVFEDYHAFHLVLEYCAGGELFERSIAGGMFTERQAARLMQQVFSAAAYMHSKGVSHRDLRLECCLLKEDVAVDMCHVKVIDFRCAKAFVEDGEPFRTLVAAPLYRAPEVSTGRYTQALDVWACGVMMYIMIAGYPPFCGETDSKTIGRAMNFPVEFPREEFADVSDNAKELITGLLKKKPRDRLTAAQMVDHPWIGELGRQVTDRPLHQGQKSMQAYCGYNKLKKAALHSIARRLSDDEILQLKDMFTLLDTNGDSTVTFHELKAGLARLAKPEATEGIRRMIEEMDVDGSRRIDYTEFIAATLQKKRFTEEEAVWNSFQIFDRDGSGKIGRAELEQVLRSDAVRGAVDGAATARIIEECDQDGDGQIDFQEFMRMMRGGGPLDEL